MITGVKYVYLKMNVKFVNLIIDYIIIVVNTKVCANYNVKLVLIVL